MSRGRLWIIDGQAIFSPNSTRKPVVPAKDSTPCIITGVTTAAELQKPSWWTISHEWLGYMPPLPVPYHGLLFEPLGHLPRRMIYVEKEGYVIPGRERLGWVLVEEFLSRCIRHLLEDFPLKFNMPFSPSRFGYEAAHQYEKDALDLLEKSRDWFSVWMGVFFWMTCRIPNDKIYVRGITPPSWYISLACEFKDQWILDSLRTCALFHSDFKNDRVGLFLHHKWEMPNQPSATVFIRDGIPVWYKVDQRGGRYRLSDDNYLIKPSSEHWQQATTWIAPTPSQNYDYSSNNYSYNDYPSNDNSSYDHPSQSSTLTCIPMASTSSFSPVMTSQTPSSTTSSLAPIFSPNEEMPSVRLIASDGKVYPKRRDGRLFWEPFLKKWGDSYREACSRETPQSRRQREHREKNPSVKSYPVFVWGWDNDYKIYRREQVLRSCRFEALASYKADQKKFHPFRKEWDCCEEWGQDHEDSDDEDDVVEFNVESVTRKDHQSWDKAVLDRLKKNSNEAATRDDIVDLPEGHTIFNINNHPSTSSNPWSSDISGPVEMTVENTDLIIKILQLHFGCQVQDDLPFDKEDIREEDRLGFVRTLGVINWLKTGSEFFSKPIAKSLVSFIRLFYSGASKIPDQLWDASMLQFSHWLNQTCVVRGNNVQFYMFDLGKSATVPWHIGVEYASTALVVARLGENMQEEDIVLELVRQGVPFHTFQDPSTLPQISGVLPRVDIPMRLFQYKFSEKDFLAHEQEVEEVLRPKRGRAALLSGGFTWRIAQDYVGLSRAMDGPTGIYDRKEMMLEVIDDKGRMFIDDKLTEAEVGTICGLYNVQQGASGAQYSKSSWFPLPSHYHGSGEDHRRWTTNNESMYLQRVKVIKDSPSGSGSPLTSKAWSSWMRGTSQTRKVFPQRERWALEVVESML